VCVLTAPNATTAISFGQVYEFDYSCTVRSARRRARCVLVTQCCATQGYDPSDTTGRLSLIDKDGSSTPLTVRVVHVVHVIVTCVCSQLPMDDAGHALLPTSSLSYEMPSTGSPGWALQVAFLHGSDTPQYSYPLTVQVRSLPGGLSAYALDCVGWCS
jgi:hypothetical protein